MIWYIIITLLGLLLVWILFGPVILSIDTNYGIYKLSLPGVISVRFDPGSTKYPVRAWLFFIPIRINPFSIQGKKTAKQQTNKPAKRKSSFKHGRKFAQRMLKVIRIKKLELDLDTDDFLLNAWLIPAFAAVNNNNNINLQVNFEGLLFLKLDIRTRIGTILWLFITKNK